MNENRNMIFIKILIDAIAKIDKKINYFVNNMNFKFRYFDLFIEPKIPVFPFEELINELKILDDKECDEFYDYINDEILNTNYSVKDIENIFKKFGHCEINYKTVTKILFISLINFEIEEDNIIKHFENNKYLLDISSYQKEEVTPFFSLIKELKLTEEQADEFSNALFYIVDRSKNIEKDSEKFLEKYNII